MNEPILLFETDPLLGTPRLHGVNGAAGTWSAKDLRQLEDQLRGRYEVLVREGDGTLDFRGQILYVKKKDGDTSRQPTLELRTVEPFPFRPMEMAPATPMSPPAVAWGAGFLAEIDRLFASAAFNTVLPVEKAMLHLVRDELKGLLEKTPPADTALLVLVSILMTAEHLSRTQRPGEPHPYAYALSGVERLLGQTTQPSQTPWGHLPAPPNLEPPPSWLGRFWNRVTGAS
jgi:hypothetical protein